MNKINFLQNLNENLKSDYLNSIDLLFEYFNHKNNLSNNDIMAILENLCTNLPIQKIKNDTKYVDQFCRFISLLCISYNIEWNEKIINLFLERLIKDILSNEETLLSLISYLPNILRTIGHVLFERGNLINDQNRDRLIALLIPLSYDNNNKKINQNKRIPSIDKNVNKLCIHYGIKKFSQSQNIETFESSKQIYQYIQECNKNKIAIHQKIKEVWKYYINLRKFSIIALGHCIIKSNKIFIGYKNLISHTMFITFHFLKNEYKNYVNNKLCRNPHDFAKSITPIIRSLSQLFNEFDFNLNPSNNSLDDQKSNDVNDDDNIVIEEDLIIQIIEDLKDLMTLGANSSDNTNNLSQTKTSTPTENVTGTEDSESDVPIHSHHGNNNNKNRNNNHNRKILSEYNEYSKRERHRYRNRVLLDWNGEQYRVGNGYTSDSVLGSAEKSDLNMDKSFFVPFDIFSKLRMYVQHCLGLLVKKNINSMNNNNYFNLFWNELLPKDKTSAMSTRPFYGNNIFTVLLYDPHPRVRNAASITLYNLLEICAERISNLLQQKPNNNNNDNNSSTTTTTNVTTISDRANETLLAMHKGLIFAIEEKEIHTTPRTQILKCLILLVNITDYNKLDGGGTNNNNNNNLLISMISIILRDISQSSGLYKSAVITLLSSIFSVSYSFIGYESKLEKLINDIMPILLQEIKKCNGPNPCCDPRTILVSLSKNYRKYLSFWWNKGLKDVIHSGFNPNQHYTIILETIKLINTWIIIIPLSKLNNNDKYIFNDYDDCMFGFLKLENSSKNLGFWLTQLLQSLNVKQSPDSAAIKSKICILVSSLKSWHFNLFDIEIQCLLLEFLSNCLKDKNYPSVRGCACKAVGNVLTINLKHDKIRKYYQILLNNLLDLLNITKENNIKNKKNKKQQYLLISKSSCAIANICNYNTNENKISMKQLFIYNSTTNANDLMIKYMQKKQEEEEDKKNNDNDNDNDQEKTKTTSTTTKQHYKYPKSEQRPPLESLIDNKLLILIINSLLAICHESKHNISYNTIRAIGNISYWIPIQREEFSNLWPLICKAIGYCLSNDKKLKNQWNACFAAGNALSNKNIPFLCNKNSMESTRDLYFTILTLLDKCENYKVKITAVYSLSCPNSRKNYGPIYYKLIKRISTALNNCDELQANGYAKQKYKQLLKFRLIVLLSHLVKLSQKEDDENNENNEKNEKKKAKLKASVQLNDKNILKYVLNT